MNKIYISAAELLRDSFSLAAKVIESEFYPDLVVGVWRGGAPVGIAVQEYFAYRGLQTDHTVVCTASYTGIGQQAANIRIHGLEYLVANLHNTRSLLLVDDVYETGRSIDAVLSALKTHAGPNMPAQLRVACPWFKPQRNQTGRRPDYYLHVTDDWLVFPHELCGLSAPELLAGKTDLSSIADLFERAAPVSKPS